MKKGLFIILALVFFTSCENAENMADSAESKKGAWSTADKELAQAEIKKVESQLDYLGENKQQFIDCYLEKVEANYSSFASANSDEPGCAKLSTACATELIELTTDGSEKGNWSDGDIDKMNSAIAQIDNDLNALGKNKQAFIDCYMAKVQANYGSFLEADVDIEGCSALSTECVEEIGF
jgi:outer membrane murein-binding lipoprotein Lpp